MTGKNRIIADLIDAVYSIDEELQQDFDRAVEKREEKPKGPKSNK